MTIENHVTSLELSKRLKELGVDRECNYAWVYEIREEKRFLVALQMDYDDYYIKSIAKAYIATELLEMLPSVIKPGYALVIEKSPHDYYVAYFEYSCPQFGFEDKNLSNALAKMLIYLIENNLIEVPK